MKTPDQTRADTDALHARVMAQFDDIDAQIARICGRMKADGLIRDPRARTRESDMPLGVVGSPMPAAPEPLS